jgi:hypothetical protein
MSISVSAISYTGAGLRFGRGSIKYHVIMGVCGVTHRS